MNLTQILEIALFLIVSLVNAAAIGAVPFVILVLLGVPGLAIRVYVVSFVVTALISFSVFHKLFSLER
ncbi:MAG: hypothetical protein ACFFBS_08510 [Promethearchaeota archaeon]